MGNVASEIIFDHWKVDSSLRKSEKHSIFSKPSNFPLSQPLWDECTHQGQLNTFKFTVGLFRPSCVASMSVRKPTHFKKDASLGGWAGSSGFRSSLKLRTVSGTDDLGHISFDFGSYWKSSSAGIHVVEEYLHNGERSHAFSLSSFINCQKYYSSDIPIFVCN